MTDEDQIIVANYLHDRDSSGIYIGRAMPRYGLKKSPLANPFKRGKCDDPLAEYLAWLWRQIPLGLSVFEEIKRLVKIVESGEKIKLLCWCKDANGNGECHGDIVKDAILTFLEVRKREAK